MTVWDTLTKPFDKSEVKQRPGPGGKSLDYVEWHTIADRLDATLTPAGWNFEVTMLAPDQTWALGRLTIGVGADKVVRENIGYCENQAEAGKSAVSDCLKRCAALFGLARELYGPSVTRSEPRRAPEPERVTLTVQKPVLVAVGAPDVSEDDWQGLIAEPTGSIQGRGAVPSNGTPTCPVHKWEMKPGKKSGYFCSGKLPDGSWCKERAS